MKQFFKRYAFFQTIVLLVLLFSTGCEQKPVIPQDATGVIETEYQTSYQIDGQEFVVCTSNPMVSYFRSESNWLDSYICDRGHAVFGSKEGAVRVIARASDFTPEVGQEVRVKFEFSTVDPYDLSKTLKVLDQCEYTENNGLAQSTSGEFSIIASSEKEIILIKCMVDETLSVTAQFYIRPGE